MSLIHTSMESYIWALIAASFIQEKQPSSRRNNCTHILTLNHSADDPATPIFPQIPQSFLL
jgi:hypothetical protein